MEEIPWLYLTCDLPPPPLYPDELQENIIPQIPFATLLTKFNGVSEKEYKTHKDSQLKRFQITRLPHFVIIFIKVMIISNFLVYSLSFVVASKNYWKINFFFFYRDSPRITSLKRKILP
jgi:U4/U6.U5 tri-snRNP-associated protein 2